MLTAQLSRVRGAVHPLSGATGATFGPHEDSIEDEDDLRDGIDKLDACAGAIPVARGAGLEIQAEPQRSRR